MKTKINLSDKVSKLEASSMRSIVGGYQYCKVYACESPQSATKNYYAVYTAPHKTEVRALR